MKKTLAFLSLILTPIVAIGNSNDLLFYNDGCVENGKYKHLFTIDRRCYVTDEQKTQIPYSASVGLVNASNTIYCSGTIFRDNQNRITDGLSKNDNQPVNGLYVYTAAHCAAKGDKLKIRLPNGKEIITEKVNVGSPDVNAKDLQDWAVYKIPENEQAGLPYVDIAYGIDGTKKQLKIIGHGQLAIMDDFSIHLLKEEYRDFLGTFIARKLRDDELFVARYECDVTGRNISKSEEECMAQYINGNSPVEESLLYRDWEKITEGRNVVGFYGNDGILAGYNRGFYVSENTPIRGISGFFAEFLSDRIIPVNVERLKESVCHINSDTDFCQIYAGNSGGGIFVDNKLYGIVSNVANRSFLPDSNYLVVLKDVGWHNWQHNAVFLNNSQQDNLERMRPAVSDEAGKK